MRGSRDKGSKDAVLKRRSHAESVGTSRKHNQNRRNEPPSGRKKEWKNAEWNVVSLVSLSSRKGNRNRLVSRRGAARSSRRNPQPSEQFAHDPGNRRRRRNLRQSRKSRGVRAKKSFFSKRAPKSPSGPNLHTSRKNRPKKNPRPNRSPNRPAGRCKRERGRKKEEVRRKARPSCQMWRFSHWEGDVEGDSHRTRRSLVTIDRDRTVEAMFVENPVLKLECGENGMVRDFRLFGRVYGPGKRIHRDLCRAKTRRSP